MIFFALVNLMQMLCLVLNVLNDSEIKYFCEVTCKSRKIRPISANRISLLKLRCCYPDLEYWEKWHVVSKALYCCKAAEPLDIPLCIICVSIISSIVFILGVQNRLHLQSAILRWVVVLFNVLERPISIWRFSSEVDLGKQPSLHSKLRA